MKPILQSVIAAVVLLLPINVVAAEQPKADQRAIIEAGNARFTVLTPQLIRMEWSKIGRFEDRATLKVVNRLTEVPQFKVTNSRSKVVIRTSALHLHIARERSSQQIISRQSLCLAIKRSYGTMATRTR